MTEGEESLEEEEASEPKDGDIRDTTEAQRVEETTVEDSIKSESQQEGVEKKEWPSGTSAPNAQDATTEPGSTTAPNAQDATAEPGTTTAPDNSAGKPTVVLIVLIVLGFQALLITG